MVEDTEYVGNQATEVAEMEALVEATQIEVNQPVIDNTASAAVKLEATQDGVNQPVVDYTMSAAPKTSGKSAKRWVLRIKLYDRIWD